jgi:hypothetical protein
MNHRTRLDWLFFWNALWRIEPHLLSSEKISLKGILKYLPGAGDKKKLFSRLQQKIQVGRWPIMPSSFWTETLHPTRPELTQWSSTIQEQAENIRFKLSCQLYTFHSNSFSLHF